jgi:hypothetical protein
LFNPINIFDAHHLTIMPVKKNSEVAALREEIDILREEIAQLHKARPLSATRRRKISKKQTPDSPTQSHTTASATMLNTDVAALQPIKQGTSPGYAQAVPLYELKEVRSPLVPLARSSGRSHSRSDGLDNDFCGGAVNVARMQWLTGCWGDLADTDLRTIEVNPDRALLALFAACGNHQIGKADRGQTCLSQALQWGCSPRLAFKALAAGVHRNLAEAARIRGDRSLAAKHQVAGIECLADSTQAKTLALATTAQRARDTAAAPALIPKLKTIRNVFVLCTGRCGSTTFAEACKHFNNFSAAHESRAHLAFPDRFDYPAKHIEVDNRLCWYLGELSNRFDPAHTLYVHLKRNEEAVALSHFKRWESPFMSSIIRAFAYGIVMTGKKWQEHEKMDLCRAYVRTVNSNIAMFLRGVNFVNVGIEDPASFHNFITLVGADGNLSAAMRTFYTVHNETI